MEILGRPLASRRSAHGIPPLASARASVVLAGAGALALVLALGWEIARPSLPTSFELAAAARSPGAASWAMRLPMATAALGGLLALYIFLRRTTDRRAGLYAIAILGTVPAWFVHGRAMTGAMLPMACSAIVLAGLGCATFDPRATGRLRVVGVAAAVAASVLSVVAVRAWGLPERGLATVVGVPAFAVGIAARLWPCPPGGARVGAAALLVGATLALGAVALLFVRPDGALADLVLGSRAVVATPTSFDAPLAALAYGLVPWTPFVPFALARRPSSAGHLVVMVGAALAIAAHAALAARTGPATIVGVASIAAAVALMMRSLEDLRRPALALVATVMTVGWLVAHDLGKAPDRVLVAFGASDAAMPAAHAAASSLAIRSSVWLCMVLAAVALLVPRTWLPTGRGLAIVAGGVFAGLVLRTHAYPELLSRLSPGAAFDAWAARHREGEPLGLVGVDRRLVAFAPGTAIAPQPDARSAGLWLAAAPRDVPAPPRRFLALATTELPRVNAEYRATRGYNVPVLAGGGGSTLLGVSSLAKGETSESPLDAIVLDRPPPSARPLEATLDDRLDVIGWEIVDDRGRRLEAISPTSRSAHVRVFVRTRPQAMVKGLGGFCTFLHVDHAPSRFSAEHRELAYPMSLWRPGDVVVDDYDVKLPAHFHRGSYRMYWGVGVLPCEDDRRMHVSEGPSDGHDRLFAGTLEVR